MNPIALLSQDTIDKIAAGEVVERPASVVKELVENAIDAGANAVTVEIRDGGISLIRITDNGCGIPKEEVRAAFLRHATSKIRTVEDLLTAETLGFRGEALSSIAAVCQVEMITKTPESLLGMRYVIEGGVEKSLEEIGAPGGTTFLVRNIFYHTPARKKFLKSAVTEAGYVNALLERMALSHPDVSFRFICNRDIKMQTSGNGKMKDIIYGLFGRETAANVVPVKAGNGAVRIAGFIGKPSVSRGNRNYENYFVNGRYVRSNIIAKAIEEAYRPFLMNHRYPFTALMLQIDTEQVDVNVHPTKMEVRFADQSGIYDQVYQAVKEGLLHRELIPEFTIDRDRVPYRTEPKKQSSGVMPGTAAGTEAPGTPVPTDSTGAAIPGMQDGSASGTAGTGAQPGTGSDSAATGKTARPSPYRYPEPFERVRSQLLAETQSPYEPKYPDHPSHYAQHRATLKPVTGTVTNHPEELPGTGTAGIPDAGEAAAAVTETAANGEPEGNTAGIPGAGEAAAATAGTSEKAEPEGNTAGIPGAGDAAAATAGASEKVEPEGNTAGIPRAGEAAAAATETAANGEPGAKAAEASGADDFLGDASASRGQARQMELFDDRLLSQQNIRQHRLIGQIFGTYWIVEFQDKMYLIDQHAAHEKVLYERFMKNLAEKKQTSQMISPPVIVTLSMHEEELLRRHIDQFTEVGFEIEQFGGREYSIRAVPGNLYGIANRTLFTEILDGLADVSEHDSGQAVKERIATMSCKAAVKGNRRLQPAQAEALISELLTLENPYNCPHGRPTIVAMTKYDLEKKFRRIL